MELIKYYLNRRTTKFKKNKITKWRIDHTHILLFNVAKQNLYLKLSEKNSILNDKLSFYNLTTSILKNDKNSFNVFEFYIFICKNLYLSKILQTPVYLKNINIQDIIPKELLTYMMYCVKSIKWKKFYIIHSNEIIEMLFLCLWLKNINLFVRWIRKYFEKNNLKKHKKLFLLFKYLLGNFIWNYNIFFRLKGLRLALRGKFGKAGSVRKTRKYIKRGKCSYTSKNLALVHKSTIIRTLTGTFSIKLEIFY